MRKVILGGLAGAVTIALQSWLIYVILLKDFMAENFNQSVMRPVDDQIMWAMVLSYLGIGFLLAFIFSRANIRGIAAGVKTGAIVGLLIAVYFDATWYFLSTIILNVSTVFVDIAINTFVAAVGGGAVAYVMDEREQGT